MKYKHAFWIGLPFTVIGLGKALHKCKKHHGFGGCGINKHKHFFTILSWRLGLSAEQKSKLHTLMKETHEQLESLSLKKQQIHSLLVKGFSQDTFDADELHSIFNKDDIDQAGSTMASAISQFHSLLTPLQREKISKHLQHKHAFCHHGC